MSEFPPELINRCAEAARRGLEHRGENEEFVDVAEYVLRASNYADLVTALVICREYDGTNAWLKGKIVDALKKAGYDDTNT